MLFRSDQMRSLKSNCQNVWNSLGSSDILNLKKRPGREHARSLYIIVDLRKGEPLNPKNIRSIRPGYGLDPVFYEQVMGKIVNRNIDAGTALKWEYIT